MSVIVIRLRVPKFLKDCVDSIRTQTYGNLEIILVDDGSPDASGKLCDEFAKQDSRIKGCPQGKRRTKYGAKERF